MKIIAGKRCFHFAGCFTGIVFIIIGCAKSGMPPGGPEDKTPPHVLATQPASGSVRVPPDSPIIIKFSEAIDRESARKALFISPLPQPEPKIKIKSDAIIITLRENLQIDKTYVVTIGTDLKDAHRVNLEQSISIAFSTGATIDSGSIAGTVFRDGRRTPGISLALFEEEPGKDRLPIDSLMPDYFTQSGEGGLFSFDYLPPGDFYLVAFDDKNRNRRINPLREMVGLPYTPTAIDDAGTRLTGIDIQLHMEDTSKLELRSVSINPDRLVRVRLNRKIDSVSADNLFAPAMLMDAIDSAVVVDILDFIPLTVMPAADFAVATGPMDIGKFYRLTFDLHPLYPQIHDSLRYISYPFEFTDGQDKAPPVIIETRPSAGAVNIHPDSLFYFRFSEVVDSLTLAQSVHLINTGEDTTPVSLTRSNLFSYSGKADANLDYGQKYRLLLDAPLIKDLSGNRMSDSTIEIAFSTMGLDTLGQLSGEVRFSKPDDRFYPVVIDFNPARDGVAAKMTIPPGQTQFTVSLLPGYYTVSGYLDRNGNGRYDYGSIIPYETAEPFAAPADTFRVRTRFESAGVLLEF